MLEKIRIFLFGREKNIYKTIINWFLIVVFSLAIIEHVILNGGDVSVLFKKETWQEKPKKSTLHINDTIYIRTLGSVNSSKLYFTKDLIKKTFNKKVKIEGESNLDIDYLNKDDKINTDKIVDKLYRKGKTIYLTNYELINDKNEKLNGNQTGLIILVNINSDSFKGTLLHEFAHSLLLNHCPNKSCVMSTYKNSGKVDRSTNFCKNCLEKINKV